MNTCEHKDCNGDGRECNIRDKWFCSPTCGNMHFNLTIDDDDYWEDIGDEPEYYNKDYGEVLHSTILKIFGDEMTYNELKFYTINKNDTSHLTTRKVYNNELGFYWFDVFINNEKVMEKKYDMNWSCDMNYYLNELEEEQIIY